MPMSISNHAGPSSQHHHGGRHQHQKQHQHQSTSRNHRAATSQSQLSGAISRTLSSSSSSTSSTSTSGRSPRSPFNQHLALPQHLFLPPSKSSATEMSSHVSSSNGHGRMRMPSGSSSQQQPQLASSSSSKATPTDDGDETESEDEDDDDLTEENDEDEGYSAIDQAAAAWSRRGTANDEFAPVSQRIARRPSHQSRTSSNMTVTMMAPGKEGVAATNSTVSGFAPRPPHSFGTHSPSKATPTAAAAAAVASSSSLLSRAYHKSPSTLQERKRTAKQLAVEKSVARREKLSGGMMAAREPIEILTTDSERLQETTEEEDSDATEEEREMPLPLSANANGVSADVDVDVDMGATPTAASYLLQSRANNNNNNNNNKGKMRLSSSSTAHQQYEDEDDDDQEVSAVRMPPPQTRKERRRSEKDRKDRQQQQQSSGGGSGGRRSLHPPVGVPPEERRRFERGSGGGRGEHVDAANSRSMGAGGLQRRTTGAQNDPDATEDEDEDGADGSLAAAVQASASAPALLMSADDFPLPEGINAADIEDVFLDSTPLSGTWSDSSEDEAILFAALEELDESAQSTHEGDELAMASGSGTDDEGSNSDDEGEEFDEDDDFLAASDAFGANMPLVLMEDWSGNLVFAQPRGGDESSRSTSKSRRKSRTTSRTSGSTGTGNDVLLVDAEAMDDDTWDEGYEDDVGDCDGDTTDSLPDEDMPSPPEHLLPYGVVAANLEAQNAAFGVTTVDEAALARDLGVPLADARILLERARAEEQQQILGGVSNLSVTSPEAEAMHAMTLGGSASSVIMSAMPALSPSVSIAASSPRVSSVSPVVAHAQPTMGSFMPESTERRAVIDGTGKATPSPFVRRGGRGRRRPHSSVKRSTIGDASPAAGRKQPRSARSSFASIRGSPLRRSGSTAFDRDDTPPSDIEAPAPPISLDDVLDTSALPHHGLDVSEAGGDSSRHLRNLRRWEKVPITTFRQSRRNPESPAGLFGSDVPLQSQGFPHGPASGAVFRPSFSSPSIGTTLAIDYKERQWQKEQNMKKAMLEAEARARRA